MPQPSVIAIDGPSGVGKNAVGYLLAKRLGYSFVDTGAMYRAITWLALRNGIDPDDQQALSALAAKVSIEVRQPDGLIKGHNPVVIDSQDVTDKLRLPEVEASVSQVSRIGGVRQALVSKQRQMAKQGRVVMVGRDIGATVLPDAELKLFLTAQAEERAQRRYFELRQEGQNIDYESVLASLRRRDDIDSQRPISPLKPATDAHIVDTDALDLQQVLLKVLDIISQC